jgi:succinate dehydrogenase / fumarate reductase, cytochrome b subunit
MSSNQPSKLKPRPLSPHLQVWKWSITMALSIFHRATGSALSIGLLLLTWGVVSAAMGAESYNQFLMFITSPIGQLMLFGWTFAIFFHMGTGVRHLIMDTGRLLTAKEGDIAGVIIVVFAICATAFTWAFVKGLI